MSFGLGPAMTAFLKTRMPRLLRRSNVSWTSGARRRSFMIERSTPSTCWPITVVDTGRTGEESMMI